ncbi:MAG: biotin/lipoyl-binding protein [Anaerolineae bacterium]|nr:biotin/lipoyl-binding protein [Anaerolineae bacterium]
MKYIVEVEGRQYRIEFEGERVLVDGAPVRLDVRQIADLQLYSLLIDGESFEVSVEEEAAAQYSVILSGELYSVAVRSEDSLTGVARKPSRGGDGVVRAPMPGLVATLAVEVGDEVAAGQTLVVLESMKMENPLQAPAPGQVTEVHVAAGDAVEKNQPVITVRVSGAGAG